MTAKFHVGQRVALTANLSDMPHPRIVESVSPSGIVRLAGDARAFNPGGSLRGRAHWDQTCIQPWLHQHDDERRRRFELQMRTALISSVWSDATDAELTGALVAALAARKPGGAS